MAEAPTAPNFELILDLGRDTGNAETAWKNREILAKAYRDMIAGDDQSLVKLLDPNVVFEEAAGLPYGVKAKGIENTLAGVQGMFGAWSHLRVEISHFAADGDVVIAYMTMVATSRATGKIYDGVTAELFRFKNGKIVEWRPIYWDTHAVRQACGLA